MKIRISTLPPHGLPVDYELDRAILNIPLSEGNSSDISFVADPKVSLKVSPIVGGVTVKGDVKAVVKQECAACAKPLDHTLDVKIDWALRQALGHENEDDDIGIFYYSGDHFELDEPIREACMLQISPFWRPPVDDGGRCEVCKVVGCGVKPQEVPKPKGTSLAAALEKAKRKMG